MHLVDKGRPCIRHWFNLNEAELNIRQ